MNDIFTHLYYNLYNLFQEHQLHVRTSQLSAGGLRIHDLQQQLNDARMRIDGSIADAAVARKEREEMEKQHERLRRAFARMAESSSNSNVNKVQECKCSQVRGC